MLLPRRRQVAALILIAVCGISLASLTAASFAWGEPAPRSNQTADRRATQLAALEEFNSLIGGWRGVAQPQRGSTKGSWSETAQWVWELSKQQAAVRCDVKDGKLLVTGVLTYDPDDKLYLFEGTFSSELKRQYRGTLAGNKLTLESAEDESGERHQIVITRLNEKRTLILYQTRKPNQQQFARVAEVGYTREGTRLAEEGSDGPLCIVTDGKGTSKVEYNGMTYWVCCTGCREAFDDDPEGIIAAAKARTEKKREKKGR